MEKKPGSSPTLFRPGVRSKVPDEGRPKRVWSLAGKVLEGVEISSSYVIHFKVVFCIYERQIVPESRLKAVPNLFQGTAECIAK